MKEAEHGLLPQRELVRRQMEKDLDACADSLARYGLELGPGERALLAAERERSLRDSGRVEFGGGILPKLAQAFCDSPYLDQRSLAETLAELQESFYYFKTEAEESLSDEELVDEMRACFDGVCEGSADCLRDVTLEQLLWEKGEGEDGMDERE